MCLRRTHQPGSKLSSNQIELRLKFSQDERLDYNAILDQGRQDLDLHVSTKQLFQKYTRLFTIMLRLRIFCNSGVGLEMVESSDPASETPDTHADGAISPSKNALNCDVCDNLEVCEILDVQESCPSCGRLLPMKAKLDDSEHSNRPAKRRRLSELESGALSDEDPGHSSSAFKVAKADDGGMTNNFPTKLSAVASNILQQTPSSERSLHLGGFSFIPDTDLLTASFFHVGSKLWICLPSIFETMEHQSCKLTATPVTQSACDD